MTQLENLLQQCTVQITIPGQPGWGTGFFVTPGLILTCAHVVKTLAVGATARIRWQQQSDFATAELVQLEPQLDLALLQFTPPNAALPCVYLDESLQPGQELYFFGYPDQDFDNGCPVTGSCEGFTGDVPPLIKFKQAQVRPGMSGSALLNRHTGKVCGMVKFTRDRSIDLGGGAIPTRVILEQFPQLRDLQREFHQRDRRWQNLVTTQSEIDFQPYLQSILDNEDYREWQEVYTPTKVEDRQRLTPVTLSESAQPRFSRRLKLRVETIKPPESENQRTESSEQREQVEQLDVLTGLRKYAPEHVLLVGKPGSGKSTSLERLLWEEADQALKQTANAKIPILVKLRRCTGTIESLMQDFCRSHQLPLTLADIETLLDQGRLLLLLDGLNELPEAFRTNVANFRDRYRATTPMIVSTRELSIGGNLGIAKMLKMLPLSEPQMQEFVRGYLGQEGNRLWQQLKGDRLRKFAETPLLLWMLCRVFAQNDRVPANLGLAFREFTQLYDAEIQQDAPVDSREQWSKLLRHLAFALMHDQAPTAFRLSMSREEAADLLTTCLQQEGRANARDGAERGLKDLLSYHLIQPVMQPNYEEHIEFRHQLIQEYYAAEYLRRILPTLSDEQLKRDYLNYLKWTEPFALMLALVDEEAQALRVVRLAIDDVDLMLGARLAGSVRDNSQPQTIDLLLQVPLPPELQIACLAETVSDAAIPALLQFLEDQVLETRLSAIGALGKLGSNAATPGLLKALKDESLDIRDAAADALRGLDSSISIPLSLQLLEDEDPSLREIASEILGELNHLEAQPKLLEKLEDQDLDVRSSAAIALGEMGCRASIPHLLELLDPPYSYLTWRATELLGELGVESAIPSLIEALNDQDEYARTRAVKSLGKYTSEAAVLGLLDALEDQEFSVRIEASESLVKLSKEVSIPVLLKVLEEENSNNRKRAIDALGEIGDKIAIPGLIKALEDEEWSVRIRAANTLGKIKSDSAVPDLVRLLKHQNSSVHPFAAVALGLIGSQDATPDLIQAFLDQSQDSFARFNIVIALGRLGHGIATLLLLILADLELPSFLRADIVEVLGEIKEKITEPKLLPYLDKATIQKLLTALKDETSYVRLKAAVALGKLGNPDTVLELIQALGDNDNYVRQGIADSLGKIRSKAAIFGLLKLLEDEDWAVRSSAINSLEKLGGEEVKKIGEEAIQVFLETLENKNWHIRRDAIDILGKLGYETFIPRLLNILDNEDVLGNGAWEICSSAIDALAQMGTPEHLAILWSVYLQIPEVDCTRAIYSIQNRCKYYNHEIAYNLLPPGKSIALYFSSAPSDAELQTKLANHLNLLERQAIITSWHHRQMLPGDERAQVINDRLNSADIILLLISADSISDHTCYDIEINRAMERYQAGEVRVIPILLRPVDWQGAPFSQLPVLPRNQQPVTSWSDRDAAFQEIAEGIRAVAIELRRTKGAGA